MERPDTLPIKRNKQECIKFTHKLCNFIIYYGTEAYTFNSFVGFFYQTPSKFNEKIFEKISGKMFGPYDNINTTIEWQKFQRGFVIHFQSGFSINIRNSKPMECFFSYDPGCYNAKKLCLAIEIAIKGFILSLIQ